MGLYADIYESNLERGYDSNMVIGYGALRPGRYTRASVYTGNVSNYVRNYQKAERVVKERRRDTEVVSNTYSIDTFEKQQKKWLEELNTSVNKLENQIRQLTKEEEILSDLIISYSIASTLVKDIVDDLIMFIRATVEELTVAKNSIPPDVLNKVKIEYLPFTAKDARKEVLDAVYDSVDYAVYKGLPLGKELFRRVVRDLKELTKLLYPNYKDKIDKEAVESYFISHCGKKRGIVNCPNCGRAMLHEIPYCFICYEGRYS